ncbi:MAG: DUF58 domain-containing protein [Dehalococcoidales bacterium]|nr:DUF58 domain-containing protein [Dehalococcoidales bacterium]
MKIRPVVIIIPSILLVFSLLLGSILLWQLFFFSVIVILFAYIWIRINIRGIEVIVRTAPESVITGEWFDEDIRIINHGKLPKFGIAVRQVTEITDHNESVTVNLSPDSTSFWKPRIFCRRRGKYTLGLFSVSAADPFGLLTLSRTSGKPIDITVFPATVDLPLFQPEYSPGNEYKSGQRLVTRTSATISRVREYTEGDTLNHIHWLSTAHKGSLMVKVFEPEPLIYYSGGVWLVLDMHKKVHTTDATGSTEELGIIITSSILQKYLGIGKKTGLMLSGDRHFIYPPGNDATHRLNLEKSLAVTNAEGEEPLESLVSREKHRFEPNSTVILITTTAGGLSADTVSAIRDRDCMAVIILIDSSTFGASGSGIETVRYLFSSGAQVYSIGKNQNINHALDSHRVSGTFYSME